jgi:hypothetical protein
MVLKEMNAIAKKHGVLIKIFALTDILYRSSLFKFLRESTLLQFLSGKYIRFADLL